VKNILFIVFILLSFELWAQQIGQVTGLNIPRYVSLKSNDVNLRVGPSINYPILIKYIQKNLPVEIIDEHSVWRQIKDYNNKIGWIHKSLLKGERYVIIRANSNLKYNVFNRPNGDPIGRIEKNNIAVLLKCLENWCFIEKKNLGGWILKSKIWGTYEGEIYKKSFLQPLITFYWKIYGI